MKAIQSSFLQLIKQLSKDSLLMLLLFVPFLAGTVFRFGLPFAEEHLAYYFSVPVILVPYYQLADALLSLLTPTMLSFVAALVILEEVDVGITRYLAVTPLGKRGYLISRLGIMTVISIPLNLIVITFFSLTAWSLSTSLAISVFGALHGLVVALMIGALSANKVEGMAIGKLTSLISLGLIVPYFLPGWISYLLAGLPSFWIAQFVIDGWYFYLVLSMMINSFYIFLLFQRFAGKLR